jgi:hypothetical protein
MWGRVTLGLAAMLALAGCKGSDDGRSQSSRAGTSSPQGGVATSPAPGGKDVTIAPTAQGSGVTIEYDPATGKSKVVGGTALKGDPKTCSAFHACCAHPEMGLMCSLTEAAGGDCASALQTARQYLKERNLKPPAGCM